MFIKVQVCKVGKSTKEKMLAMIEKFEDIIAWQKAEELSLCIYTAFRTNKDYSFRDQIQRAAVSVMNNIAEGFERKGNKEFRKFLYIYRRDLVAKYALCFI